MAYDQLEPLPDPWLQTGILAATIYNYSMTRPKGAKAASPYDYIPSRKPRRSARKQSQKEMRAMMQGILAGVAQNGKS